MAHVSQLLLLFEAISDLCFDYYTITKFSVKLGHNFKHNGHKQIFREMLRSIIGKNNSIIGSDLADQDNGINLRKISYTKIEHRGGGGLEGKKEEIV